MDLSKRLHAYKQSLTSFETSYRRRFRAILFVLLVLIGLGGYTYLFAAPTNFSPGTTITITDKMSQEEILAKLVDAHLTDHPKVIRALLSLFGQSVRVQTGTYRFIEPEGALGLSYRLLLGRYGVPPVRITFVEGVTVREMSEQIAEDFPNTTAEEFFSSAQSQEGYLFPDTYVFPSSATKDSILARMRANFDKKINPLLTDIRGSGHSLLDIVIMASLIEKEARTPENRRMVSGILWNRLAQNMPLQVDAVFGYIYGRDTYSPSFANLRVDSPYNVYIHKGLPPTPIDNPGLDSIEAALYPTKTDNLYYLTGKDGKMYYATTYAKHQENLRKYLR